MRAGPAPRIVVGLPIAVTDDPDGARERAARSFQVYGTLPNYKRVLDIEGVGGPAEVAVVGKENEVERQLRDLASAGATDFLAGMFPVGDDIQASLGGRGRSSRASSGSYEDLVAGATGVLGRPTVQALVEAGHEVRGTARGDEKATLLRSLGLSLWPLICSIPRQ